MTEIAPNLSKEDTIPQSLPRKRTAWPSPRSILFLWLPAFLVAALVLLPVIYLFIRADFNLSTYKDVFFNPSTFKILSNTLWLAFSVTVSSIALGVPLAWLTTRSDIPLKKMWSVLIPLPLVIPSYVGAYLLVSTLGPQGAVQQWLEQAIGITRLPAIYGFPGALYLLTILSYPFVFLSVRASLKKIDPSQEEAARSLGLSPWATIWRVTLPQLRPAIAAGGLLVTLYVLRDFGAVSILRYNTFTRAIYIQYQSSFNRASAASLSLVLVFFALIILFLENISRGRAHFHHSSATSQRPITIISLGKWRWIAVIFCSLTVVAALFIPALNLGYWLIRGIRAGEHLSAIWGSTANSILGSFLAGLGTLIAAMPIAIVSVRYLNKISQSLEKAAYIAFALPGIVIALALVFFGANYALPVYQTLPMLTLAYIILFLPEAVGAVRASLLQVHPSMEEAGRSLGRNPYQVFRQITLPLVRPGLLSGAGLVFLTTMKELPATLILAPLGFQTLATNIWGAVSEAFFAKAAAPALMIILISSIPMAYMILKEKA
ncbi:MAG: iron ABC transporter permease [Chloroflexota bacterium]